MPPFCEFVVTLYRGNMGNLLSGTMDSVPIATRRMTPRVLMNRSCFALFMLLGLLCLAPLSPLLANTEERPGVTGAYASVETWAGPLEALGTRRAAESVTLSATVTDIIAEVNTGVGVVARVVRVESHHAAEP